MTTLDQHTLAPTHASIDEARRTLARVRDTGRRLLVVRAVAWVVAGAIGAVLFGVLVDYVLRLPTPGRVFGLILASCALAYALARMLLPALRFRPTLTELALRLEKREAGARGVLASGLELAQAPTPEEPSARAMTRHAIEEAARAFDPHAARSLIDLRRTARAALTLALAIVIAAGLSAWRPEHARTGLARILTPWTGAEWPKRFMVADATALVVHPSDTDVPLRAIVTSTTRAPGRTKVEARYRLLDADGRAVTDEPMRAVLAGQYRDAEAGGRSGELYERLVEPPLPPSPGGEAREFTLEYWFQTEDDRTKAARVRLVDPPALVGATVEVTPPEYAAGLTDALVSGVTRLDPGAPSPTIGPALAGSKVRLRLTFNKAVEPVDEGSWLTDADSTDKPDGVEVTASGPRVEVALTLDQSRRALIDVTDENGLHARDEIAFTLEAVEDRPPAASVTDPARDDSVLATAAIDVGGEGRDDLSLRWVSLERVIASPPDDSSGAPPEPKGEGVEIARKDFAQIATVREASVGTRLDLAPLGLRPGDEVRLFALAKDSHTAGGVERDPTRSAPRVLRVISESELIDQIRGELGGVRRSAIRLDEHQAALQDALAQQGASPDLEHQQDALTQRLIEQGRVVERLRERQQVNGLDDQLLSGLLDEAAGTLSRAVAASSTAAERAAQAIDEENDQAAQDKAREASESQQKARDELASLIGLLDRGEDGWIVRRQVERLLEEQRALRDETADVGKETLGKELGELTPDQRSDLERIAERQREMAKRAREAMDELAERSRQMERVDPAQAQAMSEASQTGRERGVERKQEEAAQQVDQNQTATATQSQDEAIEALEEMLDELDSAGQNRDNALRRVLASIIESIQALITQQEGEINLLGARAGGNLSGLDEGMVHLDRNTLGVLGEIEDGPGELRPVADLLSSADEHQRGAIVALRAEAPDAKVVDAEEHESLRLLREAKSEAERQQEEAQKRDQQRQRSQLRQAYREALEEQVALAADAAPLADAELSRRDRASVRAMGARQQTLRERLTALITEVEGLESSVTFGASHKALDLYMGEAATTMGEGRVDQYVLRDHQLSIRTLRMLVEALGRGEQTPQDFQDANGGGGGGQGGGQSQEQPLIPPLSELILLRGMQTQVAELTRRANERAADSGAIDSGLLGTMQHDLAAQAAALIEQMNKPPEPPKNEGDGGGRP
ncbi:MAG: hypothetical protein R3B57_02800 [Phycisphaerales bacterium]